MRFFWVCRFIFFITVSINSVFSLAQQATGQKRPNVLICLADDASFPHMSIYGTKWIKTPAFDSVANAGLLFMNAYTPNAKCAPSRASFLTGRNSWQLEEAANHWAYFPEKYKTFMEILGENGYHTGHTQKGWGPGKLHGDQTRLLTGKAYNSKQFTPPTSGISTNDYAGNFEDFLNDNPDNKPFCFWYGSVEPHRQYEFGSGVRVGGKSVADIDRVLSYWPDNDTIRKDMLDYAYELEYFDRHVGQMLKILKERNELANTIVIITADNGMPFPRAKGQSYEVSNHMPLAIMWGDGIKEPGRIVNDIVSFIDFAPTILDAAGVQSTAMMPIEGKSLTDIFRNDVDRDRKDYVLIGKERHDVGRPNDIGYPIRGIVNERYLYLRNYDPSRWPAGNPETGYLNVDGGATKSYILAMRRKQGSSIYWDLSFGKRPSDELYDLKADRECIHNLALEMKYSGLLKKLRKKMEKELERQGDPRMTGEGNIFDEYPYADESGRDFYNRFKKGEKLNSGWVEPSDFEKE